MANHNNTKKNYQQGKIVAIAGSNRALHRYIISHNPLITSEFNLITGDAIRWLSSQNTNLPKKNTAGNTIRHIK